MSRSRHAKPGSNHNTRDLVGRGGNWQPKTSYYKRFLRKKLRNQLKKSLLWLKNNIYSMQFIINKAIDDEKFNS